MFSKLAIISSLALLAVATETPASQCTTGPVQCCQSTTSTPTDAQTTILSLLGIVLSAVDIPIGLTCSPITVVGVGSGATCDSDPVCCTNNSFNGVVALGCSPVDLSL